VGESGCGKTTAGWRILKLVKATAGKVFFNGKDLLTFPERSFRPVRERLQMVFQDPYSSLKSDGMTVNQILSDHHENPPCLSRQAREERIATLLAESRA